jgi:hypothetical protein
MKHAFATAALLLAACQPAATDAAKPAETAKADAPAAAPTPAPAPAKPSGPPHEVAPAPEDDQFGELMAAAHVTDIHFVKDADVKLFSTAGGDPAINGLYTYLAMYDEDERGWSRIFMIGDFNSWEVVEESPVRVVLKVSRSWVEQASGDIKTADEKLILDIPPSSTGTLLVTPAT